MADIKNQRVLPASVRFDQVTRYVDNTLQRASDQKVYDLQPGTYPLVYTVNGVGGYLEADPQQSQHVHVQVDAILREEHWTDLLLTHERGNSRAGLDQQTSVFLHAYPWELDRNRRERDTFHGGVLIYADTPRG